MNEHDVTIQEVLEKLLKIECLKATILMDDAPNMVKLPEYVARADAFRQMLDPQAWDQTSASCDGTRPLSP
jgi:hypothetical protein